MPFLYDFPRPTQESVICSDFINSMNGHIRANSHIVTIVDADDTMLIEIQLCSQETYTEITLIGKHKRNEWR